MTQSVTNTDEKFFSPEHLSPSEQEIYHALKELLQLNSTAEFYSAIAKSYGQEEFRRFYDSFILNKELLDLLEIKPHMECLDLGCGTGETAIALAEHVKEGSVYAVDQASGMIAAARERAHNLGLSNVQFSENDVLEKLKSLPEKSFDLILLCFCLSHLDRKQVLKEARRVLRSRGKVGVATHSLNCLSEWQSILFDIALKYPEKTKEYMVDQLSEIPINGEDLKEWFVDAGFTSVNIFERNTALSAPNPLEGFYNLFKSAWLADYFYRISKIEDRYIGLDEVLEGAYALHAKGLSLSTNMEVLLAVAS